MKYTKKPRTELVVIGGGAAGLMAAITASMSGAQVTLLERNDRVGRKLLITGKGRCNLTNNCDIQQMISNIPRNGKFLYSSLKAFDVVNTMSFFESIGVSLKTERGNRVFPQSDKGMDVVDALLKKLCAQGVKIKGKGLRTDCEKRGNSRGKDRPGRYHVRCRHNMYGRRFIS